MSEPALSSTGKGWGYSGLFNLRASQLLRHGSGSGHTFPCQAVLWPQLEEMLQEHWVKSKKAYPFLLSGSGWSAHLADEETEAHQGKAICLRLTLLTGRAGIWTGLATSDTLALPFTTSHALGVES